MGAIATIDPAKAEMVRVETISKQELSNYNVAAGKRDPSRVAWPSTLAIELALKTASPADLREHYNLTDEDWFAITRNEVFQNELRAAVDLMKQEGMTFKMKAKLQAEALLETSWRLIHAPSDETPPSVKADLIKTTFRVAGFDTKDGIAPIGANFNIQVNL
jgi:hypothetical protein